MKAIIRSTKSCLLLIPLLWMMPGCDANKTPGNSSDHRSSSGVAVADTAASVSDDAPVSDLEKVLDRNHRSEASAEEGYAPNVQILNSSNAAITLKLDGEAITISPESDVYEHRPNGPHQVEAGGEVFSFHLKDQEKVLINPGRDSIILEEILYSSRRDIFVSTKPEDYTVPLRIISIANKKYFGAYKILNNEILVEDWHFAVNELPPRTMDKSHALYRNGLLHNYLSYFKISTPKEIKASAKPLNLTNEWIAMVLNNHIHDLVKGYKLTVEQGNFVVVEFPYGKKISVAKGSVNAADVLELREVNFYDKVEHGKITSQIGVFDNCYISQDDKLLKNRKAAIVLSDKSHQPHIRILR